MMIKLKIFEKKDYYKYNDYSKVKKWSFKLFKERMEDIDPEIIGKIVLEDSIKFIHPN